AGPAGDRGCRRVPPAIRRGSGPDRYHRIPSRNRSTGLYAHREWRAHAHDLGVSWAAGLRRQPVRATRRRPGWRIDAYQEDCRHRRELSQRNRDPQFLSPVLTAASVHLDTAIPNFVVQEYARTDETNKWSGFQGVLQRQGGYLLPPENPGLGIRLVDTTLDGPLGPLGHRPLHHIPQRSDGSVVYAV